MPKLQKEKNWECENEGDEENDEKENINNRNGESWREKIQVLDMGMQ